jgi:hypothetical protein
MINSKRAFDKISSFFKENLITTEDLSLIAKGLPYLQQVKQLSQKGKSTEEQDNSKYIIGIPL